MQVRPLSDKGGVEVTGVDLSKPSPAQNATVRQLYDEHGLVVFREQNLSKQQLVDSGAAFGGTMIDPPATVRDPDVPGIVVISTRGTTGNVVPKDGEALVGDLEWHTDQGYVPAQDRLGFIFQNGEGIPKDTAQAMAWFRKAADQGYAASEDRLGLVYRIGDGVIYVLHVLHGARDYEAILFPEG